MSQEIFKKKELEEKNDLRSNAKLFTSAHDKKTNENKWMQIN